MIRGTRTYTTLRTTGETEEELTINGNQTSVKGGRITVSGADFIVSLVMSDVAEGFIECFVLRRKTKTLGARFHIQSNLVLIG